MDIKRAMFLDRCSPARTELFTLLGTGCETVLLVKRCNDIGESEIRRLLKVPLLTANCHPVLTPLHSTALHSLTGLADLLVAHRGYTRLFRNKRSFKSTGLERPCNVGRVISTRRT